MPWQQWLVELEGMNKAEEGGLYAMVTVASRTRRNE